MSKAATEASKPAYSEEADACGKKMKWKGHEESIRFAHQHEAGPKEGMRRSALRSPLSDHLQLCFVQRRRFTLPRFQRAIEVAHQLPRFCVRHAVQAHDQ